MSVSDEFQDLLSRAQEGSQDAIWQLVESLSPHLYRIIQTRMSGTLRQRIGASDIVQATWASFLLSDRPLTEFSEEDDLRAFLCGIAMNKLRMTVRANAGTQARDLHREQAFSDSAAARHTDSSPSASEVYAFRESWNSFLEEQPTHYRRIVELRLEGWTYEQIAAELRINERTVRRVLQKLASAIAA